MPTPNMSDEELDELVRRSAEAYPEELPLSNWLRMENRLQEAAIERLVRRRIWRFFGLEVGLVALLLLLWQGHRALHTAATESSERTSRTRHVMRNLPVAASTPDKTTHAHSGSALLAATSGPVLPAPVASAPKALTRKPAAVKAVATHPPIAVADPLLTLKPTRISAPKTAVASMLATPRRQPKRTDAHKQLAAFGSSEKPSRRLRHNGLTTSVGFDDVPEPMALLPDRAPATTPGLEPLELQVPRVAQLFELPVSLPLASPNAWSASASAPDLPIDSVAQLEPIGYRLVAGVIGAPAWTAVRTLATAQLGGNLGVTLEYRLTRQLRVRTGLVRSVKRYEAASSDYTPLPAWGWRPGNYEVYASCRVTEIPLDLRYDVVRQPTYTVFAGIGLTSLLMRNERYAYDYQANGQTHTVGAKVVNGSNYAFGLLNLAGGVERVFGSRWSGQVEPFVQLPLGSVGAGKVRLSSAGISFSLKYGLLR